MIIYINSRRMQLINEILILRHDGDGIEYVWKIFQNEWKKFPKKILNIYYGKNLKEKTRLILSGITAIKKRSGFFTSAPPDGLRLPPVLFRVHFSRHLLVDAVEFGLVAFAGALQVQAFVNPRFTQFVEYGLVRV